MIEFSGISKKFGRLPVLEDVSLRLQKGRTVALIGPNGSGKTTLIKCLLGMVVPDKGHITFGGRNILEDWSYRTDLGYMPQIGRYPDNMTIAQLFGMIRDIRRMPDQRLDEDLIRAFRLPAIYDKRMRTLSGGTRQKVSACLAFLFDPAVIVLDEPTAGLDPVSAGILTDKILTETQKGKLVLVTSHILSELDDLVDEVVYLQDGRIRFHKTLPQLRADTGEHRLVRAIAHVMENSML
ncbi:MAG TPA: ABC transporter ATP-binding protein [Puia sp.]|nr:ABC transporter ATP-binding protein [Puia sp.]